MKRVCPFCGSDNLSTERRIDGRSTCLGCGLMAKTSTFPMLEDEETPAASVLDLAAQNDAVYVAGLLSTYKGVQHPGVTFARDRLIALCLLGLDAERAKAKAAG